jgi:hypothetical protein
MALLQGHEFGNGTEIISQVQIACRLNTGKDARFLGCHCSPMSEAKNCLGLWRAREEGARATRLSPLEHLP